MSKVLAESPVTIFIRDEYSPEDNAMLQALYSRDPRSVLVHEERIKAVGSGKFMQSFYVGYGHQSIGDCGSTTLYIEDVSMFVAKAIQDWPLYRGQESSTRYLDMMVQPVLNPLGTPEGAAIQERWMNLYTEIIVTLQIALLDRFPRRPDEDEHVYFKAIKAKAFDIARGFLPAGMTTKVSWHTDLRQAHDHLQLLAHHPLAEVRGVASHIQDALREKYPNSFGHKKYAEQEQFFADVQEAYAYFIRDDAGSTEALVFDDSRFNWPEAGRHRATLEFRPVKTELPKKFAKFGSFRISFPLDFGSFRDIQRHRAGVCEMPLLSTRHGFSEWYLDQLPEPLRTKAQTEVATLQAMIECLNTDPFTRQYYVAMGFLVACEVTWSLPEVVYVAELRSGLMVHPTLRRVAQQMGEALRAKAPWMALYHDMSEGDWDIKRGTQDIVQKA